MSNAAHTPGPWSARREMTSLCVVDAGDYIADIHDRETYDENLEIEDEDASRAESEANARLIAAAPELLEALESLACAVAYVDALPGEKGVALFKQAHAAIAKAKGGDA